jgi:hypothetical protein
MHHLAHYLIIQDEDYNEMTNDDLAEGKLQAQRKQAELQK